MKLYLTEGFDGEKIHGFGDFQDENTMNKAISNFLANANGKYRTAPCQVITSTKDGKVVDFGDYSYFLKIEG